jgi:hypothetical protein
VDVIAGEFLPSEIAGSNEGDSSDTGVFDKGVSDGGNSERGSGGAMASKQMRHLAALFGSGRERFSSNNLGLEDVRDICERLHAASREPEGVTYAEVDASDRPLAEVIVVQPDVPMRASSVTAALSATCSSACTVLGVEPPGPTPLRTAVTLLAVVVRVRSRVGNSCRGSVSTGGDRLGTSTAHSSW